MYKMRFFDFEVLPNWWLVVFGDLPEDFSTVNESIKNNFDIITSDDVGAREKLIYKLREQNYCNTGYNIKGYDLIIANGIYQGFSPRQIKILNDIIINPGCSYDSKEHILMMPFSKKKISNVVYQDLLDDGSGSLKEKEATLGLSVLESSVDFNKEDLTDEDKSDLIYYCKQDVYAAMQFYMQVVHPYTQTKLWMGKTFNIPEEVCHKSTNAKLVAMALKAKKRTYKEDENTNVEIPDKIKQYCYDNLPINVIDKIRTSKDGFKIKLFDNIVSFGNGGIHSTYIGNFTKEPCLYLETNDEYVLRNVDAASYYPSIMIQLGLLSRSVQNPEIFTNIFEERIRLKHKENKTEMEEGMQKADKLVLNATFGASGNKYLDLYDPYMCTSVCRVGQLFLASFACKIHKSIPGVKIVQTNTDGILVYCPRRQLDKLKALQEEWTRVSGINMEEDDVIKIWQRDVNNYLMLQNDHGKVKVKRKGGWLNDDYYRPGYVTIASANAFVCSKAAINFLVEGKDVIQSILENKNIKDFTITCTKGPTFRGVVQRDSEGNETPLFKANRVYASKDVNKGKLYKYKVRLGKVSYNQMPDIPEHCGLINDDVSHYDFKTFKKDLDYLYYITRTYDLLDYDWYSYDGKDFYRNHNFDIEY